MHSLCLSPLLHASPSAAPHMSEQRIGDHCGTSLTGSGMVPITSGVGCGLPQTSAEFPLVPPEPQRGDPSPVTEKDSKVGGVMSFGVPVRVTTHLHSAIGLLEEAVAPSTGRAYASAWILWIGWYSARDLDPTTARVNVFKNFLSHLFDQGKAFTAINVYRLAVSSGHVCFDDCPAGQHALGHC